MAERQTDTHRGEPGAVGSSEFSGALGAAGRTAGGLHVCPVCDSRLVYPVDWALTDERRLSVALRCPDCEWIGGGVYSQDDVDRFDEVLDRGTEQLLGDLRILARTNMEDQVDGFAAALAKDLILPEDF